MIWCEKLAGFLMGSVLFLLVFLSMTTGGNSPEAWAAICPAMAVIGKLVFVLWLFCRFLDLLFTGRIRNAPIDQSQELSHARRILEAKQHLSQVHHISESRQQQHKE